MRLLKWINLFMVNMASIKLNLSLKLPITNTHKSIVNCLFRFNNLLIKLSTCHYLSTSCSVFAFSVTTTGISAMARACNLNHTWSTAVIISHNQSICKPCQFELQGLLLWVCSQFSPQRPSCLTLTPPFLLWAVLTVPLVIFQEH